MEIIEKLLTAYPAADVSGQDFIDRLTPGAPGWEGAWLSVALAVIFGLLVYIIPLYLAEKDKAGPYPLWMHTFYWAADFMGIWVFLAAWGNYGHFLLFLLLAIGEAIWVCMETWCLYRAVTYEREAIWGPDATMGGMVRDIVIQIVVFYVGLNFLRFELHDETMWKFWIFTQVLITIVPGLMMEKRGTRMGNNLALHVVLVCVALVSFNPWCNMWTCVAPDFFGIEANPWYYLMGAVCLFFAIRGCVVYTRLPEKAAS